SANQTNLTQGPQSLALGLTLIAARQLVESSRPNPKLLPTNWRLPCNAHPAEQSILRLSLRETYRSENFRRRFPGPPDTSTNSAAARAGGSQCGNEIRHEHRHQSATGAGS